MSFTDLSHKQLVLLSKLSRQIKQSKGINIKLNEHNVMSTVSDIMQDIEDPNIKDTYSKLQQELGTTNSASPRTSSQTMTYRGTSTARSEDIEQAMQKEKPRKKIMYRGQEV